VSEFIANVWGLTEAVLSVGFLVAVVLAGIGLMTMLVVSIADVVWDRRR